MFFWFIVYVIIFSLIFAYKLISFKIDLDIGRKVSFVYFKCRIQTIEEDMTSLTSSIATPLNGVT